MSTILNATRGRGGRRLMEVAPALLLAAPLVLAPITAASAAHQDGGDSECYTLGHECVPFSDLTKDTKVLLGSSRDGSTKGWTNVGKYHNYIIDGGLSKRRDGGIESHRTAHD